MTSLLDQILANLDDDGPRLVYADALQAAGDPRGELISVQCELARLGRATRPPSWDWIGDALLEPDAIDDAHVRKLRRREAAVLKEHGATFTATVPNRVNAQLRFERGFLAHATFNGAQPELAKGLAPLLAAAPTIGSFELVMLARDRPEVLFEAEAVGERARTLDVPTFGARALADRNDEALRELHLRGDDADGARELLAHYRGLARLTTLGINGAGLDARDLEQLLAGVGELVELQLRQSAVGAAGAKALAASKKAGSLRVLSLLANGIGPDGARALAGSKHLAGLRALDLRKNKLGVEGARAVGAAFPELRTLNLTANPLGEAGVAALAGGEGLRALRELCLQQTSLDDDAVVALAGSPLLERVRVLNLRSNKIGDAGARALARSPGSRNLLQLNLNNNAIGAAGKAALASSKHLRDARVLA